MTVPSTSTQDVPTAAIVDFLERNHFNVKTNHTVLIDLIDTPLIEANKQSCHLQIARLTFDGANWNVIRHLSAASEHLFIVFRGRIYKRQPILWTILDHFWSTFLRELGLAGHSTPPLAVAADASCDAKRLPWTQLREIPG